MMKYVSLPARNVLSTSILMALLSISISTCAADEYGFDNQGAIADNVYYQIGGGSAISPSLTRRSTNPLTVGIGWNADLMCGNFDINTTVKNQLNGVTDGFKDLMGDVISNATGAVASLPAMIIQRANPQLYDLLTNGVLQGRLDFDKAKLSCENMAEKMTDYAYGSAWVQGAKAENYQTIASGETDAVRANQQASKEAAEKGKRWVGGQQRGGKNQAPIKLIRDTTVAGFNILNGREPNSTSTVNKSDCKGQLCKTWTKPEDAAKWMTRVVGEQTINVAPTNDQGSNNSNKSGAQAGVGLNPLIQEEQDRIIEVMADLVNGKIKPTSENLAKASGGNLMLTRGVVEALQDDPDAAVLVQRLSGEMAIAEVTEQALLARRAMLAGMREPNIANEKEAQDALGRSSQILDQELTQLKLEMDMRKSLADNAATTILNRKTLRDTLQGRAVESSDDVDSRVNKLNSTHVGEP
ncbi:integrating conjugative element protein [Photorhabdus sp. S14-60]|uniref:integrating conjugative element protein n=2 Tax=Gammaproteobacteria TaxID=1236 RepID=UPI003510D623